jgi:hypothetical protein
MLSLALALIAVNIVGYTVVFLLLRQRIRRAASPEAQAAELRDEVNRLIVELNQTTDRNVALIEDRIASLSDLLSKADRKIGLLRRESEKHDVGAKIYDRLADSRPHAEPQQALREAPPGRPAPEPRPSPFSDTAPQAAAGGGPETAGATAEEQEGPVDLREQVVALHRAGFSPALIASRVKVPKGEVDLIISLLERKGFA